MVATTTDRQDGASPEATEGGRRAMAMLALVVAAVVAGYWLAWWLDRGLVAVEHRPVYVQFEDAFVLADGWLFFCLVASAFTLWTRRPSALLWLVAGGGAGLYLFGMDDLYDLQHGIWGKGGNGVLELAINVATLVLSIVFLRWAWRRRRSLLGPARGLTAAVGQGGSRRGRTLLWWTRRRSAESLLTLRDRARRGRRGDRGPHRDLPARGDAAGRAAGGRTTADG